MSELKKVTNEIISSFDFSTNYGGGDYYEKTAPKIHLGIEYTTRLLYPVIEKQRELLKSVNDHAETCSIFIYNEKGCTCYYEKIQEYLNE